MLLVFIEYKVKEEMRERFLAQMSRIRQRIAEMGGENFRFYEGLDQPHLFVESFEVSSVEQYQAIKEWRRQDEPFANCIVGGREKINVWAFQPVPLAKLSSQHQDV